jgi:hypothetical protein
VLQLLRKLLRAQLIVNLKNPCFLYKKTGVFVNAFKRIAKDFFNKGIVQPNPTIFLVAKHFFMDLLFILLPGAKVFGHSHSCDTGRNMAAEDYSRTNVSDVYGHESMEGEKSCSHNIT